MQQERKSGGTGIRVPPKAKYDQRKLEDKSGEDKEFLLTENRPPPKPQEHDAFDIMKRQYGGGRQEE